jgi:regulator of sirC expression with transglutaminase-like and TPR domain
MLAQMGNRDVLLRLQGNIQTRLQGLGQPTAALACTEDMLRLAPGEPRLWREAAEMHQRLDQVSAALRCFARFLDLVPTGDAATRARTTVSELRARLN